MIASRSKNFIFVKTRKVAGTSLEFALSRHCTDEDIVTPTQSDIERAKAGVWPRNFMRLSRLEEEYRAVIASGDYSRLLRAQHDMRRDMLFWDHMPAKQIRDGVGRLFWDKAYKFSTIRHPYEFVVSLIYYQMSERSVSPTGLRHLRELLSIILRATRNIDIITIEGRVSVDKVIRFEMLRDEVAALGAAIGVDIGPDFPRLKADIRPPKATATAVLRPWAQRLIRWRWKCEFETFGYLP